MEHDRFSHCPHAAVCMTGAPFGPPYGCDSGISSRLRTRRIVKTKKRREQLAGTAPPTILIQRGRKRKPEVREVLSCGGRYKRSFSAGRPTGFHLSFSSVRLVAGLMPVSADLGQFVSLAPRPRKKPVRRLVVREAAPLPGPIATARPTRPTSRRMFTRQQSELARWPISMSALQACGS